MNYSSLSSQTTDLFAQGILQIYEPPLVKVKADFKELIAKQNKIYIDLFKEKFNFVDNLTTAQNMIDGLKIYKEKLVAIKEQMRLIHQRMKSLKKRAIYIQLCREKELVLKIQKQQQEESLIERKHFDLRKKN